MKVRSLLPLMSVALVISGCQQTAPKPELTQFGPSLGDRIELAGRTCEAEATSDQKDKYLSAIQDLIHNYGAAGAASAAARAPLDHFRDEVTVAYRNIVNRCRAYMQCMEYNRYDERACAMSGGYYREAERDFSDLTYKLGNLQREMEAQATRSKSKGPSIVIKNSQNQENTQTTRAGDDVKDDDTVIICRPDDLLSKGCRKDCNDKKACR